MFELILIINPILAIMAICLGKKMKMKQRYIILYDVLVYLLLFPVTTSLICYSGLLMPWGDIPLGFWAACSHLVFSGYLIVKSTIESKSFEKILILLYVLNFLVFVITRGVDIFIEAENLNVFRGILIVILLLGKGGSYLVPQMLILLITKYVLKKNTDASKEENTPDTANCEQEPTDQQE